MLTFEEMWAKIIACDRTYDGLFFTAVKTTKIYCRPSCRSRKPLKQNVTFYRTLAEAEVAGYRACKRCQPEVDKSHHDEFVHRVVAFIVEHFKQPLQLNDIAAAVGLSPFHVERTFKQETGMTPRQFLLTVRVDKAKVLLYETTLTNVDICYEVGFRSPSHFYATFRQATGQSPTEYRHGLA